MKEENSQSEPRESINAKTVIMVMAILLGVSLAGFAVRKLVYDLFPGGQRMSWTEVALVSTAVALIALIIGYFRMKKKNNLQSRSNKQLHPIHEPPPSASIHGRVS